MRQIAYNALMENSNTTICFENHISASQPDITAIDWLTEHTSLSRQQLKKAMNNGAVWLESQHGIQRLRRAKKTLKQNDILHIYYDEAIQSQIPPAATLIADENHYSIWHKPGGMFSQGSKWGDHCTVYRWAECHLEPARPAYLVHRLDRAASGLIIIAHDKKTTTAFVDMFSKRQINKQYRATTIGDLSSLKLPHTIDTPLDDKAAESVILTCNYDKTTHSSNITIAIKTGRKHQIRRHLASIQHPLIGDRLYGHSCNDSNQQVDLQLCAVHLSFSCPVDNKPRTYSLAR